MHVPEFTTSCAACHRRIGGEQAERARGAHRPIVICDRCVDEAPEIGRGPQGVGLGGSVAALSPAT